MWISFAILFFILGLIVGSFLNVVILRLNTRSLRGRSACMSCQNKLRFYELVPLFSFFLLKGRCRTCKTKISIQYPLVEFITGLIFALLFFKLSAGGGSAFGGQDYLVFAIIYAYYAVMFSILIVVAVYDLKHKIIPDMLSFVFGTLAFAGLFFIHSNDPSGILGFYWQIPSVLEFLSGVFIAFPFAFFWFISGGRWMGLGDAKLALGIGWFLGLSMALSALTIAFWSGAIIGLSLMFLGKSYGMKTELPFAPYMVFGTLIAFIFELHIFYF